MQSKATTIFHFSCGIGIGCKAYIFKTLVISDESLLSTRRQSNQTILFQVKSAVLREETLTNHWQLDFEDLIETILQRIRANDSAVVGEKNDTSAPASIVYLEEAVLDDTESAVVLAGRLSEHDLVELLLTFLQNAIGQRNFVLSDFEFELFFEQLDHSLHNTHKAHQSG